MGQDMTTFRSGYVKRYHSNPDIAHLGDTLAHHQGQVAQIIFALHPNPSLELIYEALHHDVGEMDVGDMGALAKQANPDLRATLADLETQSRISQGCPPKWLDTDERAWLKLADRLQAYKHVQHVAPHLLRDNGWPECRRWILGQCAKLGIDPNKALA
jgi:hypothetical protein